MLARRPAFREAADAGAGRIDTRQSTANRRQAAPVQLIGEAELAAGFHRLGWLPEADNIIQRFSGGRDLHQVDGAFAPFADRLDPQAGTLVVPADNVLIVLKVVVKLQQAETARVLILIGIVLQLLRVIQRTGDPFAAAGPHRQAIGIMDLWMVGVAHAALVGAAAEHAGHRRNAELADLFAREEMVFHLHHYALRFAVNGELIGAGDAGAIQQGVNDKRGIVRFRRLKPERGEVGELFAAVAEGVDRHTACGEAVLIGVVHRAEIAGTKEGDDIAARQLRFFKGTEAGEAEIVFAHQLLGIYLRVVIVKQLRAEMDLTRLTAVSVNGKHADAALKAHTDMEKLHVELTIGDSVPQRMTGVVLNFVVRLRRQRRQRLRQRAWRATPGLLRQRGGFLFQYIEIEAHSGAVSNAIFCPGGLRKQRGQAGHTADGGEGH